MSDRQRTEEDSVPLSRLGHVDELRTRFESAWKAGQRPRIEDCLAEGADAERFALLRELIPLEVDCRRRQRTRLARRWSQRSQEVQSSRRVSKVTHLHPAWNCNRP